MIPIETAATQIGRLGGLKDFPKDPALQFELAEALSQCASEGDAREFIDAWKRYNVESPREAQIHSWIESRRLQREATQQSPLAPYRCDECQDMGWIYAESGGVKRCPACRGVAQKAGQV
jgi:hypothetical protein